MAGVVKLTHLYFKDQIDVEKLQAEIKKAEELHEYTFKDRGWSSIPLRSLRGMIGPKASDACGEHLSNDENMFEYTSVASSTPYIRELMELVRVSQRGGILKARLLKLDAGAEIGEHQDVFIGGNHKKVIRYHIPIITNPSVIFHVNYKPYYLEKGELYSVDTSLVHSVKNSGDVDRIHLVFDVVRD